MIIKAGISGRLDKYPTNKLSAYQSELFEFLDNEGADFMNRLRNKGAFDEELEKEAAEAFDKFEETFRPDTVTTGIDSGYTVNLAMALSQRRSGINRDMMKLVERITARELASPSLENEIEQIISGKDVVEKDRFEDLVETCTIMDYEKSSSMKSLFKTAAKVMAKESGELSNSEIYAKLIEREKSSSTALSPFFAIPHIVVEGKEKFQMMIVRSRKGIKFSEEAEAVHSIFFLLGSMDQRHFHLVVLSSLAQIVQHPDFEKNWLSTPGTEGLRKLILNIKKGKDEQHT